DVEAEADGDGAQHTHDDDADVAHGGHGHEGQQPEHCEAQQDHADDLQVRARSLHIAQRVVGIDALAASFKLLALFCHGLELPRGRSPGKVARGAARYERKTSTARVRSFCMTGSATPSIKPARAASLSVASFC